MNKSAILEKYKRCLYEYTNAAGSFDISEEGEDTNTPQDAQGGVGMDSMDAMGTEGGAGMDVMGAEGGAGMDAMGTEGGTGMDTMGAEGGVEGFNPQGSDMPMQDMNGEPNAMAGGDMMQPNDEVIDVDDLTQAQEKAEEKIDAMNSKFEKLMGAVEILVKQNAQRDKEAAEAERRASMQQAKLESELEKRIPTPQQRMTMRSTKSAPYAMTPNEYMNNYAPENYSDEDDNNGADDMQYQITKDDIDRFTDYASIAKELNVNNQNLHDILGY